jgi:hypothetical protein
MQTTSIRAVLVVAMLAGGACSAPGTASTPEGTVLSGRVTFSPDTDAVTKFAFPAEAPPSLALPTDAARSADGCVGLAPDDGADHGMLAWQFRAPDDQTFEGLQFSDVALYVDPSAPASASATATLLAADDATDALLLASTAGAGTHASPDDLEDWIGGRTSFIVQFALATTGGAAGDPTAAQALRRCPGDPLPFSMAVITSAQL